MTETAIQPDIQGLQTTLSTAQLDNTYGSLVDSLVHRALPRDNQPNDLADPMVDWTPLEPLPFGLKENGTELLAGQAMALDVVPGLHPRLIVGGQVLEFGHTEDDAITLKNVTRQLLLEKERGVHPDSASDACTEVLDAYHQFSSKGHSSMLMGYEADDDLSEPKNVSFELNVGPKGRVYVGNLTAEPLMVVEPSLKELAEFEGEAVHPILNTGLEHDVIARLVDLERHKWRDPPFEYPDQLGSVALIGRKADRQAVEGFVARHESVLADQLHGYLDTFAQLKSLGANRDTDNFTNIHYDAEDGFEIHGCVGYEDKPSQLKFVFPADEETGEASFVVGFLKGDRPRGVYVVPDAMKEFAQSKDRFHVRHEGEGRWTSIDELDTKSRQKIFKKLDARLDELHDVEVTYDRIEPTRPSWPEHSAL